MASGVVGYAIKDGTLSPRPFYAGSLRWGEHHWNRHFMLTSGHGAIAEPIVNQSGYTNSEGWNLNPLTGSGSEFVAAIALKSSTNRSGVWVSPYNEPVTTLAPPTDNLDRLHQCEAGFRTYPDLASTGGFAQGFLIDLQTSPWYEAAGHSGDCRWVSDWHLPTMTTDANAPCEAAALQHGTVLGINLADTAQRRCPSWTACAAGSMCCISQFDVGTSSGCAVKHDSTVWCWGKTRDNAQIGAGSVPAGLIAQVLVGPDTPLTGAVQVATSTVSSDFGHACARTKDGHVWCWGRNSRGQLGDGTTTQRWTAVRVVGIERAEQVAVYGDSSCARKTDGTLWRWGSNGYGRLGDGTTLQRLTPVLSGAAQLGSDVAEISLGNYHSCARKGDGTLWCWGYNGDGQLGDGTTTIRLAPARSGESELGSDVAGVALGNYHSCARKADGTLWCWGPNYSGELGDGTTTSHLTPVRSGESKLGSDVAEIALGSYHSCARKADGSLWCWGYNAGGQLGDGTFVSSATPVEAAILRCDAANGVCSRHETNQSSPADCRASSCGHGRCGGEETHLSCAADCPLPASYSQLAVGQAVDHMCVVKTDGSLWCWGYNVHGELGDGTRTPRPFAVRVGAAELGTDVAQVALGSAHSCARKTDDTLWCWGDNYRGQLGDGTAIARLTPLRIGAAELGTDVAHVASWWPGGRQRPCLVRSRRSLATKCGPS